LLDSRRSTSARPSTATTRVDLDATAASQIAMALLESSIGSQSNAP
jgi:hypothetical protein